MRIQTLATSIYYDMAFANSVLLSLGWLDITKDIPLNTLTHNRWCVFEIRPAYTCRDKFRIERPLLWWDKTKIPYYIMYILHYSIRGNSNMAKNTKMKPMYDLNRCGCFETDIFCLILMQNVVVWHINVVSSQCINQITSFKSICGQYFQGMPNYSNLFYFNIFRAIKHLS